jgi:hypothetical protein
MSTLEFVTKEGVSREEIYAVVSRGYNAMMNSATDVVFSIDGPGHINPMNGTTKKMKVETGEGHNVLNNTAPLGYLHAVQRRIVSNKLIRNIFPLQLFYKLVYCTYICIYNLC